MDRIWTANAGSHAYSWLFREKGKIKSAKIQKYKAAAKYRRSHTKDQDVSNLLKPYFQPWNASKVVLRSYWQALLQPVLSFQNFSEH